MKYLEILYFSRRLPKNTEDNFKDDDKDLVIDGNIRFENNNNNSINNNNDNTNNIYKVFKMKAITSFFGLIPTADHDTRGVD